MILGILGLIILIVMGLNFRSHRVVYFPFVDPFFRLNDGDFSNINDSCIELVSKKPGRCYLKGNDPVVPKTLRMLNPTTIYYDGDNYIDLVFGSEREGAGLVWRRTQLLNDGYLYSISKLKDGKQIEIYSCKGR
jgi:hypothetical protein